MVVRSPAPIVKIPENPTPKGVDAFWIEAGDGTRLRALTWTPEAAGIAHPRGTVFVFNGRTEFAEKYFEVIGELIARDFAVATLDWRGQGLSDRALPDPRKGYVGDFNEFDGDLASFMGKVAPDFPRPWIALAHSMGGNILTRGAHDHPEWFSALVLSAPMLGLRLGRAMGMIRMLAFVATRLGFGDRYVPGGNAKAAHELPFEETVLTHDARRYAIYQALTRKEPKLGLGSATFGWLAASFRSIERIMTQAWLGAIKLPVLISVAGHDQLIERSSLEAAAKMLPDAQLVAVEGADHEVLIETDDLRAQFWRAFDAFVSRCLG